MYTPICRNCAKMSSCTQEISKIAHIFAAQGRPNCYKNSHHEGQGSKSAPDVHGLTKN